MDRCSISIFLLLFSAIFLVQCDITVNEGFAGNVDRSSLPLILKYLNTETNTSINFNSGTILNSELKGDNLEVDALISTKCKIPSEQCSEKTLNCRSILRILQNKELEVLSISCLPNAPVIEEPLALPVQDQSCAGCLNDVNINAEGIEPLGKIIIQHIESERNQKYNLLEILKVQRQVVNGVNFFITVKIAPALCDYGTKDCDKEQQEQVTYCLVKFFQEAGYQKPKNIIKNNCTKSQTFVTVQQPFRKPEKSENDIESDLMSQIIPYDQFERSQKKDIELVQSNPVKSVESSSVHNLVDENGQPMISSSTFQEVLATEDEPISLGTDTAGEQEVTPINPSLSSRESSSIVGTFETSKNLGSTNQNENIEVTSQNIGLEQGNSISAPIISDSLEESQHQTRIRRSVINSEKFSPHEKAAIQNIANFVASTLDTIDDDNHKRIVLQIINVKKIKTNGLFLNMNLRIGVSKCEETNDDNHCKDNLFEELTKFCKVQVLINENFENPKVIKSHCENEKQAQQKANRTSKVRSIRSLLGGKRKINVDNPKIKQFLIETVNYLNKNLSMGSNLIQVNKVLSATSQVVSGMSYDIKIEMSSCDMSENSVDNCSNAPKLCDVNVWDRRWKQSRVITVDCGGPKLTFKVHSENTRRRRSVPGGWSQKPIDNPSILPHLNNILNKMDAQSDKNVKLRIKSIISVSSQVVAGTNWHIKAKVAFSDCSKSEIKNSEKCGESADPFETVCDFKFWEKLPDEDGFRELDNIKVNCLESKLDYQSNERKRRSLVGELDSQSGKEHRLKVKEILLATTQVVAGTNWNIRAKIALSDCTKTEEKKIESCKDNKEDSFETICTFKFWEKLPDKNGVRNIDNVEVKCEEPKLNFQRKQENQSRTKRTILLGGHNAVPNDDPRIKEHLNKLLPRLDLQSGKEHKLKIKEIISAISQVVAGTNWNIRAKVVLSDCAKTEEKNVESCEENKQNPFESVCTFKFWERLPNKDGVRNLDNVQVKCDDLALNLRYKRDILSRKRKSILVGGYSEVPNDDPRIGEHLNKLLPKLDSQSEKEYKLKIKEILSAKSQVVAGTNWDIKAKIELTDCLKSEEKLSQNCETNKQSFETVCDFKFWEKLPDKNGLRPLENVQVNCGHPTLNYRSKRSLNDRKIRDVLVGGHNKILNDDPRIEKHLNELLPQLDSQSGKEYKLKIKEVLSATTQVVAGTNWNIKAKVVLTNCLKSDEIKVSQCGDNDNSFVSICHFKFWEKLPDSNGNRELGNIEVTCDQPKLNFKKKGEHIGFEYQPYLQTGNKNEGLLGGEYEVDKNDPLIYEYLSRSLQHIDLNSPQEYKFKVKEVILATKKLVEGDLWKIKVRLVLSDCSKNDVTDWEQCGDLQGAEPKNCVIQIWDRPWIKKGRETNISCENQKTEYTFRSKRSTHPNGKLSDYDYTAQFAAFEAFERKYNKQYSNTNERIYRFSVFRENMWYVKQLNEHEQGTATYGPTQFADMTRKEFSKRLGYRADLRSENEIGFQQAKIPDINLPDSFDWRDKNAVTEVKNQGSCGSCWAFSVTGNIEGQYAIKTNQLLEFSEQELVDCDKVDEGCNGGLMDNAYRQIEKLGGLEEEKDYPYDGRDEKCHFKKSLARVQLSGAVNISSNETDMAKWLLKNGPISIAINANAMQFYVGGVSHPWKFLCNPKNLDHGVLIVGYGVHTYPKFKKSLPYWIVKNSWGDSWGEQGYYRVYRGDGTCGVNQTPSSAILK
ncbi:hypothetical protein WA026_018674 [Henosepilachna vigintioctopunctata]|uniref:Cysteine proteinase n=1 Tax=Henosepilachna vigintioctopunctata TaxID=420089 RepID=A0AAW1U528_9CUCU